MGATESYTETFVELIRRASTELPADVLEALEEGRKAERRMASLPLPSIRFSTTSISLERARHRSARTPALRSSGFITQPASVREVSKTTSRRRCARRLPANISDRTP